MTVYSWEEGWAKSYNNSFEGGEDEDDEKDDDDDGDEVERSWLRRAVLSKDRSGRTLLPPTCTLTYASIDPTHPILE